MNVTHAPGPAGAALETAQRLARNSLGDAQLLARRGAEAAGEVTQRGVALVQRNRLRTFALALAAAALAVVVADLLHRRH